MQNKFATSPVFNEAAASLLGHPPLFVLIMRNILTPCWHEKYGCPLDFSFPRLWFLYARNRPLTVLGAERRLFFVALIFEGAIFSLLHSLRWTCVVCSRRGDRQTCHEVRRGDFARALQLQQVPQTVRPHEVGADRGTHSEARCSRLNTLRRTGMKQAPCRQISTCMGFGTSTAF